MKLSLTSKRLLSASLLALLFLIVTAPSVHAASSYDWTFHAFLPACNEPCDVFVSATNPGTCHYPGDPGEWINKTYNLNAVIALMVNIMKFIFSIVGSLALGMFIWGGFQILISRGDPKQVNEGKTTIVNAVIGLGLVFSSWMIVNFIMASLTGNPNTNIGTQVTQGVSLWQYGTNFCTDLTPPSIGNYPTPGPTPTPDLGTGSAMGDATLLCQNKALADRTCLVQTVNGKPECVCGSQSLLYCDAGLINVRTGNVRPPLVSQTCRDVCPGGVSGSFPKPTTDADGVSYSCCKCAPTGTAGTLNNTCRADDSCDANLYCDKTTGSVQQSGSGGGFQLDSKICHPKKGKDASCDPSNATMCASGQCTASADSSGGLQYKCQ